VEVYVRVLVVGGTRFVGRHIVKSLLDAGHQVTLFHRGSGDEDPFPQAEHRHGDRDGDLAALAEGEWDATVDVSAYVPRQVRALGEALGRAGGRAGRYLYISSVSAYADAEEPGITESSPLAVLTDPDAEEVTDATYGGLKALCEYAAVEVFGSETLIVRPTVVIGPYDDSGRFTYWVRRLADGGEVLAAGPRDQPVQVVDARDLAEFVVRLLEDRASGPFHVAGPPPPHGVADLLDAVREAVAPEGTAIRWIDPATAKENGLDGQALPLWHGGQRRSVAAADPSAALARGLRLRPIGDSARDTLKAQDVTPLVPGVGLDRGREEQLLRSLGSDGGAGDGGDGDGDGHGNSGASRGAER
jgi:2'-hydroxyisoflavone reductase